ncbi:ArsC family reductase [Pseudohalioglobus lutimaris]|uniref:ArsC family reductase n=1 Tax=Pseudohalioglobus lutimaris TaxID=1737061 RepID=A0A2N5X6E9_9GAMM|nr:ArsC family reductase [Pseudohalioglobus lutimaris]
MITLYGIKNCDTVKKARKWLDDREIEYRFHDVRADGLERETVMHWLQTLGWEILVNKRSTTWKALDPTARDNMDDVTAAAAILEHPTLFKRPVLDTGHELHCGFSSANYQTIFNHHTL